MRNYWLLTKKVTARLYNLGNTPSYGCRNNPEVTILIAFLPGEHPLQLKYKTKFGAKWEMNPKL